MGSREIGSDSSILCHHSAFFFFSFLFSCFSFLVEDEEALFAAGESSLLAPPERSAPSQPEAPSFLFFPPRFFFSAWEGATPALPFPKASSTTAVAAVAPVAAPVAACWGPFSFFKIRFCSASKLAPGADPASSERAGFFFSSFVPFFRMVLRFSVKQVSVEACVKRHLPPDRHPAGDEKKRQAFGFAFGFVVGAAVLLIAAAASGADASFPAFFLFCAGP
mmetsp:Transcript_59684/g.119810  ORF Transcript_59684/g.119810 Transcript_59684/m.119810 type:complete len:221 (-) Transcript_59684:514-1176(-)